MNIFERNKLYKEMLADYKRFNRGGKVPSGFCSYLLQSPTLLNIKNLPELRLQRQTLLGEPYHYEEIFNAGIPVRIGALKRAIFLTYVPILTPFVWIWKLILGKA